MFDEADMPAEFNKLSANEQTVLCNWIRKNFIPIKSFNVSVSSYRLKQLCDHDPDITFYVSHGMFKQAMIECGFKVKNPSEINWFFNISKKSPGYPTPRNR